MWGGRPRPPPAPWLACQQADEAFAAVQGDRPTKPMPERLPESSRYPTRRIRGSCGSQLATVMKDLAGRSVVVHADGDVAFVSADGELVGGGAALAGGVAPRRRADPALAPGRGAGIPFKNLPARRE